MDVQKKPITTQTAPELGVESYPNKRAKLLKLYIPIENEIRDCLEVKLRKKSGHILDDDGVGGLSISLEYGHLGTSGIEASYDPTDAEARQAAVHMAIEARRVGLDKYKYALPATSAEEHDTLGPQLSNYHLWQRNIKNAF